jgi:hypothetical protein
MLESHRSDQHKLRLWIAGLEFGLNHRRSLGTAHCHEALAMSWFDLGDLGIVQAAPRCCGKMVGKLRWNVQWRSATVKPRRVFRGPVSTSDSDGQLSYQWRVCRKHVPRLQFCCVPDGRTDMRVFGSATALFSRR